jgi:hypothetical protein
LTTRIESPPRGFFFQSQQESFNFYNTLSLSPASWKFVLLLIISAEATD